MENEATGIAAAVKLDTLLALGVEDPFALSEDAQRELLEQAAADGRLEEKQVRFLRESGVISG